MAARLPVELLPVAGAFALLCWPRGRTQPTHGRLFAEAFGMTLVAVALVWAAWVALW
jgi:hypothetical protein